MKAWVFLACILAVAVPIVTSLALSPGPASSEASLGDEDNDYKAEREELPAKCDCGCGMAFLDCDMDCPSLDSRSSKDEEKITEDLIVEWSEVPPKQLPPGKWIKGVRIDKVFEKAPATDGSTRPGKKGNRVVLEKGDIITHINGAALNSTKDYLELMRGNKEKRLTVIDWRKKTAHNGYFRPKDGRLGIKIQMVRFKIKKEE
jgi:hypothetical protein